MNELALFAGAGGGILAGQQLGWRTVCAVEWNAYAASVLAARQNDGLLPTFPIWDDVRTFDGRLWHGVVDVVSGGFPCQDISAAGGAQDWTASDPACGPKWQGSLARYNRDSRSWKTAQCSLLGDSDEFSETWPKWGTTVDGELYLLPMPALRTDGNESGLWQTPVADDAVERKAGKWNSRGEPKLSAEVKLWPTPTASLGTNGGRVTPRKAREGGTLIEAVSHRQTWPTPVASMAKGSSPAALTRKSGSSRENDRLDHKVMALDGGQLNPTWVEWLMGWPLGWTDLQPLETGKSPMQPPLRGAA